MTIIYFDVDGVFNALPWKDTDLVEETGWETWERVKVNGYWITYSPELVAAVNEIAARPDTDVRWLTTWCDDAPKLLAPALGIEGTEWPVLGTKADVDHQNYQWWKFTLIREALLNNPEPVVWVDDDMLAAARTTHGMFAWSEAQPQLLQICPWIGAGVTKRHIEEIVKFLDDVHAETSVV
jgi:hypothetical protein